MLGMPGEQGMRRCSKCGEAKPETLDFFTPSPDCRNGISGVCRVCRRKYHREWKAKKGEPYKERRRALWAERRELELPKRREQARIKQDRDPFHARATVMRGGMQIRSSEHGIQFDADVFTIAYLTDWLMSQRNCACCGREFDVAYKHDGRKRNDSPSLDRIHLEKGYVVGNIALVCWRCNNLKRDSNPDELQRVVDWMRTVW